MLPRVQRGSHAAGKIDPWLTLAFIGLMCIGVLMVYSSSIHDAYTYYGSASYVVVREVIWATAGFILLAVVSRVQYRWWQRIALPFFGVALLMLVLVLTPHVGHAAHGARRWLSLSSSIALEPSELVKLAMVVYMASWLASKGERVRDFKATFVPFAVMVGVVAMMIVKQPDLGTAIVITGTMFSMFFIAGADVRQTLLAASGAAGFAWVFAHNSSYRYDRITAFMNPWHDPTGKGYHTIQALLALGSGGLIGRGFGNSLQKNWLPAPHTDSILAVIGEEWGLMGTLTVLALFLVIAYRGMRIALTAPDKFSRLLAAGITSWITFQALLNFAVITSSVPFTGVPLPFISYGGTSLTISMTAMGVLLSISRHASGEAFARASTDNGWGNGRTRLSRSGAHPAPATTSGRRNVQRQEPELAKQPEQLARRSGKGRGGEARSNATPSGTG